MTGPDPVLVDLASASVVALILMLIVADMWWLVQLCRDRPERPPTPVEVAALDPALIARAEQAGEAAAIRVSMQAAQERAAMGPGRHRAESVRDRRRAALKAPTQAFKLQIKEDFGIDLQTVGPREDDLRTPVWAQPELLEVVP